MTIYKTLVRPLLFRLDPERAHNLAGGFLKLAAGSPKFCECLRPLFSYDDDPLNTTVAGLSFPNPVGLAAGFDKGAEMVPALAGLGFGFVEVGTFTPKAQEGNAKPRLFRLPPDEGLVNSMGFNNPGGERACGRLEQARQTLDKHERLRIPIGVNIGKGRDTPLEEAVTDYLANFEKLYPVADYFVLNVSSPNTPHLRRLENPQRLGEILIPIQSKNREMAARWRAKPKPIFVKISPDLVDNDLGKLSELLLSYQAGAICTNTAAHPSGGLSGKPISEASTRVIRTLSQASGKRLPIIGVGGITSAETAYAKIRAGARAVQIYTGWIYEGPGLVRSILKGLVEKLKADGFHNISEAVGADVS